MITKLGPAQRDTIFPANIILDRDLVVRGVGPVIARRFPEVSIGTCLTDHFRIGAMEKHATIQALAGTEALLDLEPVDGGLRLSGWVLPADDNYLLALRIAPDSYALDGSDLKVSDFAPRDPAIHGLLMYAIQHALLDEQKQSARELEKANQQNLDLLSRFGRLAGFIAHDFNNLISIVRLNCDRLLIELEADPKLKRVVDIIKDTVTRGSAITRSLMALANQRDDSRVPIPLDQFLHENREFLATTVGSKVEIVFRPGAEGAVVLANQVGILNSLVNVLINARDAMPGGGRISITSSADKETATVEIADTGLGMDEAVKARAFEPMFSTKAHGNGLGLASVLHFAVESGGDAQIRSQPGEGTTVSLILPRHYPAYQDSQAVAPEGPESGEAGIGAPRLLLVDDEPYALEALSELLAAKGFAITASASAEEAIEHLRPGAFHALLSDIDLPGASGADLAREACRIDPALKLILMSGYVPRDTDLDADWMFLRKPLNTQVVTEMLRTATHSSG